MPNPYAEMMGAVGEPRDVYVGGPVEIVGDRAVVVAEVDNPAKYLEGKFVAQDRIDIGFGNAAILLAAPAQLIFTATASTPFKPEELTIPSWLAPFVSVIAIDIGPNRYIDGGPVPGDQYSEVSNTRKVSWGTVQTGVPMSITLRNDTVNPLTIKFCLRGLRLR
jgi:hypothetical protein